MRSPTLPGLPASAQHESPEPTDWGRHTPMPIASLCLLYRLQEAEITHLWLPPPSQSVAPQGYLPGQVSCRAGLRVLSCGPGNHSWPL